MMGVDGASKDGDDATVAVHGLVSIVSAAGSEFPVVSV